MFYCTINHKIKYCTLKIRNTFRDKVTVYYVISPEIVSMSLYSQSLVGISLLHDRVSTLTL